MFRFAILASVLYFVMAQYGAKKPESNPAPAQYGEAPPQPPTPVILTPVQLPELPASHEILIGRKDRRHHSRSRSRSGSREKKCRCRNLKFSCNYGNGLQCYRPHVEYERDRECERAIVTCPLLQRNVALVANRGSYLSYSVGSENVLKCDKKGRWVAYDIYDDKVNVRSLQCILHP